jgi:hypothetical protein
MDTQEVQELRNRLRMMKFPGADEVLNVVRRHQRALQKETEANETLRQESEAGWAEGPDPGRRRRRQHALGFAAGRSWTRVRGGAAWQRATAMPNGDRQEDGWNAPGTVG